MGLKKLNLEALEKERPKVSPLGPPRMGKSTESFEEETSKEGNNEE